MSKTRATQVPGIPKVPNTVDPVVRQYLEQLAEAVEIRLGRKGDPRDRAITLRELIDSGLAKELASSPYNPNAVSSTNIGFGGNFLDPNLGLPPQPKNLTAAGLYSSILLNWDVPRYVGHAQTLIYRHTSNDVTQATQEIGVSPGFTYLDPVGSGKNFYYWVRFQNQSGGLGPYSNSANGISAVDVDFLLGILSNNISQSDLVNELSTSIDLITADASTTGSIANARQAGLDAGIAAVSVFYSDAAPSAADSSVGDLWFDTNDLNKMYRRQSSTPIWIEVDDGRIGQALTNAGTANSLAGTKAAVYVQDAKPTGGTYITGDIWLDSNDGYKIYIYDETASDFIFRDVNLAVANVSERIIQSVGYAFKPNQNNRLFDNAGALITKALVEQFNIDSGTTSTSHANHVSWAVGLPLAQAIQQAFVTDTDGNTAAIQQTMQAMQNVDGTLESQYSVKLDVAGRVAGFGISSVTSLPATTTPNLDAAGVIESFSQFACIADRFTIWPSTDLSGAGVPATGLGTNGKIYYDTTNKTYYIKASGSWSVHTILAPFSVTTTVTTATDSSGTSHDIPAGVYINTAMIKDATIVAAKIKNLNANIINAGTVDASHIQSGTALVNRLQIDNNHLFTLDGELILRTGTATNGVKIENLSNDATTLLALITDSNYQAVALQGLAATSFLSSQPYYQATVNIGYGQTSTTTLPILQTLIVRPSKIPDDGEYIVEFEVNCIASLSVNSSTSSAMAVMRVQQLTDAGVESGTYADVTNGVRATVTMNNGTSPLTPRSKVMPVTLQANKQARFDLYVYHRGLGTTSVGHNGVSERYIKLMRIPTRT